MPIVRTSSKFQIALPKKLRTKLGIKPGQLLAVEEEDGRIVITPVPADPIEFLWGALRDGPPLT